MSTAPSQSASHASGVGVLRHEAEALLAAADRLDPAEFGRAVELLARCEGNVATAGAGTSGIIARKIAATLTSTGTPAVFVHPADALHGGLGVIGSQEVVIAVSNSGETSELSALMPYLRRREVPVIAIVGNLKSSLARDSAIALEAFAAREAGHLDIVPTASSTVALAVGDALAIAVMELKGTTAESFAENHPSGRLGRRLTLRVSDVMHTGSERAALGADASLLDAVTAIGAGGMGAVVILEEGDRLAGLITDGDVRRTLQRCDPSRLNELTARDMMTAGPVTIAPGAMAYDALRLMEERPSQIAVLPVVDGDACVGIVRLHDLVRIGL